MITKLYSLLLVSLTLSTAYGMEEASPSKLGGSSQEWYQEAQKRNLTNPILLRFVYASRNPAAANSQRIISRHPGTQKDYIFGLVGPQSFTLYDEAYISMDHFDSTQACITIRAPNQQVYFLNFEKASNHSQSAPLFKAILEKIIDTSAHNQSLQHKDHQEVLKHLKEYQNRYKQVGKDHVDTLEDVVHGNVITILAEDSTVYISKGNR